MIKSLTSLRGIFIIFIFFHHCLELYPGGGSLGVAFFFVLGGFSMTLGYKEKLLLSDFSYKNFITRRCAKFYPLHWICLLAAIPLVIRTLNFTQIGLFGINAALIQSWIPVKEVYFSYNAVSWYLADTLFFALVFPFVLRFILKCSVRVRTLFATSMAIIYIVVASMIPQDEYHAILYISPYMRLSDFIFGIFIALGFMRIKEDLSSNNTISGLAYMAIIVFLIAILVFESFVLSSNIQLIAPVYWPVIACLILFAALTESNLTGGGSGFLTNKLLVRLGDLSFTIFMVHQLVFRYTDVIFNRFVHYKNTILYVAITLIITILLSVLIERYFLTPITQWLTKKNQPSMTALS